MSPLATIILAWAAVYAYVCLYHCAIYAMGRRERLHLMFGLLAGTFAIYAVGAALMAAAATRADAATALGVKIAGLTPAMAIAVVFAHELADKRSVVTTVAIAWAGLGLILAGTGQFVDPASGAPPATWGFAAAPLYPEPAMTGVGVAYTAVSWALVAYAAPLLVPLARRRRDAALILASFAVNLVAGVNDILIQIGSLRSVYLLEHSVLLSVIVMSSMLLDRFVRTSEQLSMRTQQLRASYAELQTAESEIVLKEHLAAVGELCALVALEVRDPLAGLREAALGLVDRSSGGDSPSRGLDTLDDAVEHLNRLVSSLVSFAKPADSDTPRPALGTLVHRAVDVALGAVPGSRPFAVETQLHDPDVMLDGDPDLLEHALATIVRLAGRSAPHRPVVLRSRRADLDGARAIALACGPGPEGAESTPAGAEPAVPRGDVSVALVDRVLRMHGGKLAVEQGDDGGKRVTLTIREVPANAFPGPSWDAGGGI